MSNVSLLLLDGCWGSQLLGVLDFVTIYRLVAQQRGRGNAVEVKCYGLVAKQLALGYGVSVTVEVLPESPVVNSLVIVPGIEYGQLQQVLNLPAAERERISDFVAGASRPLKKASSRGLKLPPDLRHQIISSGKARNSLISSLFVTRFRVLDTIWWLLDASVPMSHLPAIRTVSSFASDSRPQTSSAPGLAPSRCR